MNVESTELNDSMTDEPQDSEHLDKSQPLENKSVDGVIHQELVEPPKDFVESTLPQDVPQPKESDPSVSSTVGLCLDSIDRLTAIELLHLLKEYKKREFLYVSQIASLQHELHLKKNVSQAPLITDVTSVPVPFEISPAVYHDMSAAVHNALIDPTVNLEIRELRLKLYEQAVELQKTKDELKASIFSADSVMGRRLINKCKTLQAENTDIGKMLLETNIKPLQIQLNILQHQLSFFKQQLKSLYSMIVEVEQDNEKLTKQLQAQTIQYKAVQNERDHLAKKLEESQLELALEQKKMQDNDTKKQPVRQKSVPKESDVATPQQKSSPSDLPPLNSTHYRSLSPSPSKHRHRRATNDTSFINPSGEPRSGERKGSHSRKSVHHTATSSSSKYNAPGREDRTRRRRGTYSSYDPHADLRETKSNDKTCRTSTRSRY